MHTKLVEFKNQDNETLRGIMTLPEAKPKAGTVFLHGLAGNEDDDCRSVSVNELGKTGAMFLQGFERNATVEKKSKLMAGELAKNGIASLRYDAAGCGLSDGDFAKITLNGRAQELLKALSFFKKECGEMKVNFVAHSLGMCPLALVFEEIKELIGKMIFIAPALNQKDLMRFYFVRDLMKSKAPEIKIDWQNYRQYFDEEAFLDNCRRTGRMVRENYINPDYFLEAKDMDFSHSFDDMQEKILHVHGERDLSVPLESVRVFFPNRIIVPGGDHDLERPDFWEQWFPKAVEFLTK